MFRHFWPWLRDPENRGALAVLLSLAGAVFGGSWALYTYTHPPTPPGAVAASKSSRMSKADEDAFYAALEADKAPNSLVDRHLVRPGETYDAGGGLIFTVMSVRGPDDDPIVTLHSRNFGDIGSLEFRKFQKPITVRIAGDKTFKTYGVTVGRVKAYGVEILLYEMP